MTGRVDRFLEGRIAVVTGGGRGIGRASAVALAEAGARHVAVIARTQSELREAAAAVEQAGAEATAFAADLRDAREVGILAARLSDRFGVVDVLVNNAGTVAPLGPTETLDAEEILSAFRVNVLAPVLLAGALLPRMVEQGWGRIVNVSSGVVADPGSMVGGSTYAATKAALEAQTLSMAAEYRGTGVTVNAYRPGGVDTAMQEWIRSQDPEAIGHGLHGRFLHYRESGSLLTPEQSALALVAHLAGDVTGSVWNLTDTL